MRVIKLAMVDFPEPVVPITASVSPCLTVKLTPFKALIPESGYTKLTSLNSILPSISFSRFFSETMSVWVFKNSLILFCEAAAL